MARASPRLEVVVDFIEIEFQTSRPTQARHIYKYTDGCLMNIETFDQQLGKWRKGNVAATRFCGRVQAPQGVKQVQKVWEVLQDKLEATTLVVTALEIAFDTYQEGASKSDLAEISADRYRWLIALPIDGRWYYYRQTGEGRRYILEDYTVSERENGIIMRGEIVQHLENGWQLTDANSKAVDRRWHIYVKTHDSVDHEDENGETVSSHQELTQERWRARIEITLRADAVPCQTLAELAAFDFASLARHFRFRKYDNRMPLVATYTSQKFSGRQLGRHGSYRRPVGFGRYSRGKRLVYRHLSVADTELNRNVLRALERLTRAWRK